MEFKSTIYRVGTFELLTSPFIWCLPPPSLTWRLSEGTEPTARGAVVFLHSGMRLEERKASSLLCPPHLTDAVVCVFPTYVPLEDHLNKKGSACAGT